MVAFASTLHTTWTHSLEWIPVRFGKSWKKQIFRNKKQIFRNKTVTVIHIRNPTLAIAITSKPSINTMYTKNISWLQI